MRHWLWPVRWAGAVPLDLELVKWCDYATKCSADTPDEWVWKNVKHDQVKRVGVQRGSELFEVVTWALERLQRLPETIRGFFQDPSLAYIGT